jgi:hypothetical protein
VADAFGYPVTFGMMAVSYLAAAGLLLLVRETTERRSVLAPSSR